MARSRSRTRCAAIERLGWIGEPVVVIGDQIGGRRLPFEPQDRVTWVRSHLGLPDVAAVVVDEPAMPTIRPRTWNVPPRNAGRCSAASGRPTGS